MGAAQHSALNHFFFPISTFYFDLKIILLEGRFFKGRTDHGQNLTWDDVQWGSLLENSCIQCNPHPACLHHPAVRQLVRLHVLSQEHLSVKWYMMLSSPRCQLCRLHAPTYPAMFWMETLLESMVLCWDRLLANTGAAVVSSARRTADRGRSLGWEAAEDERTPLECQWLGPSNMDPPDKYQTGTDCFVTDPPRECNWRQNSAEVNVATVSETVKCLYLLIQWFPSGHVHSTRFTCLYLQWHIKVLSAKFSKSKTSYQSKVS